MEKNLVLKMMNDLNVIGVDGASVIEVTITDGLTEQSLTVHLLAEEFASMAMRVLTEVGVVKKEQPCAYEAALKAIFEVTHGTTAKADHEARYQALEIAGQALGLETAAGPLELVKGNEYLYKLNKQIVIFMYLPDSDPGWVVVHNKNNELLYQARIDLLVEVPEELSEEPKRKYSNLKNAPQGDTGYMG